MRKSNTSILYLYLHTTTLTMTYLITLLFQMIGGYVAFPSNVEIDEETGEISKELDDPDLLQNRPPLQRAIVISGKFQHPYYSAFSCCFLCFFSLFFLYEIHLFSSFC